MNDWRRQTISPKRETPPKVHIRYPCPGLGRFFAMLCFLPAGLGAYYGGLALLGMPPMDWDAPVWTGKHVGLLVASFLAAAFAGLLGFGFGMSVEVRSERANSFIIILWQFLGIGSMIWFSTIGMAMSLALGKEQAKAAVLQFGTEKATRHVLGVGVAVGVLQGIAFYLAKVRRGSFLVYLAFCVAVCLVAAWSHFNLYGIASRGWIAVGIVIPFLLLWLAPPMIERDHQQRRQIMEDRDSAETA